MPYVFKEGDPKSSCDRCGFTWALSKLKREWTNLMVCPRCFTLRNQQEFIRGITETVPQNTRHVQTMDEIIFIDVPTVYPYDPNELQEPPLQ